MIMEARGLIVEVIIALTIQLLKKHALVVNGGKTCKSCSGNGKRTMWTEPWFTMDVVGYSTDGYTCENCGRYFASSTAYAVLYHCASCGYKNYWDGGQVTYVTVCSDSCGIQSLAFKICSLKLDGNCNSCGGTR